VNRSDARPANGTGGRPRLAGNGVRRGKSTWLRASLRPRRSDATRRTPSDPYPTTDRISVVSQEKAANLYLTIVRTGAADEPDDVERLRTLALQCRSNDPADRGHRAFFTMVAGLMLVRAEPNFETRERLAQQVLDSFSVDAPVPAIDTALTAAVELTDHDRDVDLSLREHSKALMHAVLAYEYHES
jgi:hypothetical protein